MKAIFNITLFNLKTNNKRYTNLTNKLRSTMTIKQQLKSYKNKTEYWVVE